LKNVGISNKRKNENGGKEKNKKVTLCGLA
jgi:hypothetical protein